MCSVNIVLRVCMVYFVRSAYSLDHSKDYLVALKRAVIIQVRIVSSKLALLEYGEQVGYPWA